MVAKGEVVYVHYRGTLDDGREFDSSYRYGAPLEIAVGEDEMLPGFEKAIATMEVGDTYSVRIPPEEAYGLYDESLVEAVPAQGFPGVENLPVGKFITVKLASVNVIVKVLKIEDGLIYLDHNHELAGQALNFEITLVPEGGSPDSVVVQEDGFRSGGWGAFAATMKAQLAE